MGSTQNALAGVSLLIVQFVQALEAAQADLQTAENLLAEATRDLGVHCALDRRQLSTSCAQYSQVLFVGLYSWRQNFHRAGSTDLGASRGCCGTIDDISPMFLPCFSHVSPMAQAEAAAVTLMRLCSNTQPFHGIDAPVCTLFILCLVLLQIAEAAGAEIVAGSKLADSMIPASAVDQGSSPITFPDPGILQ